MQEQQQVGVAALAAGHTSSRHQQQTHQGVEQGQQQRHLRPQLVGSPCDAARLAAQLLRTWDECGAWTGRTAHPWPKQQVGDVVAASHQLQLEGAGAYYT